MKRPKGSVREKKAFFESLSNDSKKTSCGNNQHTSEQRKHPPLKPKRTFEHQFFTDMEPSKSSYDFKEYNRRNNIPQMICCSEDELTSEESINNTQKITRAVSLVRSHSTSELLDNGLDTGVTYESDVKDHFNYEQALAQHHRTLYYASAHLSPEDKRPPLQQPKRSFLPSKMRRKFAFKKPKGNSSKTDCQQQHLLGAPILDEYHHIDPNLERRTSRASLVRRGTVAHRKEVEEFCGSDAPRLFQATITVTIEEETDLKSLNIRKISTCNFLFPDTCGKEFKCMSELFYPDYSHAQRYVENDVWPGNEEYVIALTESDGRRRYAYCVKFLPSFSNQSDPKGCYPMVMAVISPVRNSLFYLDLVRNAYVYAKKGNETLKGFLESVYKHPYPKKGSKLIIEEKLNAGLISRIIIQNSGTFLGQEGAADIVMRLTPEVTCCLIAALLGEQRVLIAGNSLGDIGGGNRNASTTSVVQMLESIIRPLPWPHTFIPMVPDNLVGLCDNPTPYLMGILRYNLNKVKDLIVEDKEDVDRRQQDFLFVDIDNGVVNPAPIPRQESQTIEEWKYENAVVYCRKLGWTRKLCSTLVKGLRAAVSSEVDRDRKVQEVMLSWYADLFGHYRFTAAHLNWNDAAKRRLVEGQPDRNSRPYLAYLVETVMFEEFIKLRKGPIPQLTITEEKDMKKAETSKEESSDIVTGSDEELALRLDQIWLRNFNNFTPRPLSRVVNKVSSVFHLKKKRHS